jgi:hypothetical protein
MAGSSSVVTQARPSRLERSRADPGLAGSGLKWLPVFLLAGVALVVVLVYGLWAQPWTAAREEEQAKATILEGTAAELRSYQHPTAEQRAELEQYFLSPEKGGDRLARIQHTLDQLIAERRRFSDQASDAVAIKTVAIAPDGQSARVVTTERWYQPLVQVIDGFEQQIDVAGHPRSTNDEQLYLLRKVDGRWYIQSNPVH